VALSHVNGNLYVRHADLLLLMATSLSDMLTCCWQLTDLCCVLLSVWCFVAGLNLTCTSYLHNMHAGCFTPQRHHIMSLSREPHDAATLSALLLLGGYLPFLFVTW
jgi:hypothetical protein